MAKRVLIDIETRSSVDIGEAGSYKYAQDEDFRILLIAFKVDDAPTELIDFSDPRLDPILYQTFLGLLNDPTVIKVAYNAQFEWFCFKMHGEYTPLSSWHDIMAHGMYLGYPASLEKAGEAAGLPEAERKSAAGKALIRYFCTPQKPTKKNGGRKWNEPHHDPAKWEDFKAYCIQDVETEYALDKRFRAAAPFPESEQYVWEQTTYMNAYGVRLDRDLMLGALSLDDTSRTELLEEAKGITGKDNPNSNDQLLDWLDTVGYPLPNLTKDTVAKALEEMIPEPVRRVLEIRQQISKTSVKKYAAMQDMLCTDGRIRGLTQYYGARTGRFAGRGVQIQNLTKHKIGTVDEALRLIRSGNYNAVKMLYGNVPDLLSQMIRMAFIPSEGRKLIVADFSAIEARVLAWLAGETWVNEVFASHGKIYEATAAQMFHVPIETIVKGHENYALRQKGKVATLALGYQGGDKAMVAMGALNMGIEERDLKDIVDRWRRANPNIVSLWHEMEDAAKSCVEYGGERFVRDGLVKFSLECDVIYGQTFLTMQLPSGRKIYYAKPFLKQNRFGSVAIHHYGVGLTKKWEEQNTYSGKLTENAIQSIARDCLIETLFRMENRGLPVVFHVHDEVVIDAPLDTTVEEVCDLMGQPISWAPGLVLKAAGFESPYYMKD